MPSNLGSENRPLRVAIVGSGPSAFYAAQALFKSDKEVVVDMFERLPAPYGLVRYGVAPDHAKIKNVTKVYAKTAESEGFNYFGNVNVGEDISVDELKQFYDAVLFAYGAASDRSLGIEGEDLTGSFTATEFVAWYNGHPLYQDRVFDLSGEVAVIIGQGNVAMDVCRILCKTVDELKTTDITQNALDVLSKGNIKEIHMIGRRGPVQTAFTAVEIREFGELADCAPVVDPKDLEVNETSQKELEDPALVAKKKNYDILTNLSQMSAQGKSKKYYVHFLESPKELVGNGKLAKVILEKNELTGEPGRQKAKGTGETTELKCDIFFRSVGYRGTPIEGVPFHEQWGSILHEEGRVVDQEKQVVSGLYTAGWIKRGPSGIIGTNKPDSEETVRHLLEDVANLEECATPDTEAVKKFLSDKHVPFITFADWKKIDAAEIANGEKIGKPREKFTTVEAMLEVCAKTQC